MVAEIPSGARQPRVFLSYSRADRPRVAKLAEALKSAGLQVWWDAEIETGSRFSADIERELDAADAVVVAWSASSVASTWVLDEAAAGRDRGRLLPVQLDGTPPPLGFRQFQSTDLADWKGRTTDPRLVALVGAICKMAGEGPGLAAVPARAAASASRRTLIGGGAALGLLAVGGAGAWRLWGDSAVETGPVTLAVLPFANLSGDPAQAYFSDGLAEELRSALAQIPGVQVVGQASSEKFRGVSDPLSAARELGVAYLLSGSVRRSPTTIRISARLIDGKSGFETWAQDFDRPIGDSLSVQGSIAAAVIGALSKRVGTAAKGVQVGGTRSPEAQALFLEGSTYPDGNVDEAGYLRRIGQLDAAIAIDPRYAEAYRFKAIALGGVESFKTGLDEALRYRRAALDTSARAIEIEPNSARLLGTYAQHLMRNLEVRPAVAAANRAVAIAANNGTFSATISRVFNAIDPTRALDLINGYIAVNLLDEFAFDVRGESNLNLGRFELALADARRAHELSNGYRGENGIFRSLLALDRIDEARQLTWGSENRRLGAALVEACAGNVAEAERLMSASGDVDPRLQGYGRALVLSQLGRFSAALDELESALLHRDLALTQIAFDPFLDPLRKEARFKAVQDKVIPPDLLVKPKGF